MIEGTSRLERVHKTSHRPLINENQYVLYGLAELEVRMINCFADETSGPDVERRASSGFISPSVIPVHKRGIIQVIRP